MTHDMDAPTMDLLSLLQHGTMQVRDPRFDPMIAMDSKVSKMIKINAGTKTASLTPLGEQFVKEQIPPQTEAS